MLSRGNIFLTLTLMATVVASVVDFAPPETVDVPDQALPAAAKSATQTSASVVRSVPPSALRHDRFSAHAAGAPEDLFPVRSWLPPPPVAQAVAAPTAPPLPFKYLGKVLEEGAVVAFVSEGARTHLLRKGDALPPYRVDNITPQEATLTYLPLNETQRLNFGSAN